MHQLLTQVNYASHVVSKDSIMKPSVLDARVTLLKQNVIFHPSSAGWCRWESCISVIRNDSVLWPDRHSLWVFHLVFKNNSLYQMLHLVSLHWQVQIPYWMTIVLFLKRERAVAFFVSCHLPSTTITIHPFAKSALPKSFRKIHCNPKPLNKTQQSASDFTGKGPELCIPEHPPPTATRFKAILPSLNSLQGNSYQSCLISRPLPSGNPKSKKHALQQHCIATEACDFAHFTNM